MNSLQQYRKAIHECFKGNLWCQNYFGGLTLSCSPGLSPNCYHILQLLKQNHYSANPYIIKEPRQNTYGKFSCLSRESKMQKQIFD